jgi:hypothetical protein
MAESPTPPPTPSAIGFNWPHTILLLATAAALGVVVCSFGALMAGRTDRVALYLAMFMSCFSVFKLMVALRALREVRLHELGQGPDPREFFGTRSRFRAWLTVKFVVSVLAMLAALFILVHGPGSLK